MCCLGNRRRRSSPKPSSHPPRCASHASTLPSSSSSSLSSRAVASSSTDASSSKASGPKGLVPDAPSIYRFDEICRATGNFDPAKKVGRSVWKAVLRDSLVAISQKSGCAPHFSSLLHRIHSLHHFNLVRLLGACREGEFLFLVYEFMESSSLHDCLRSKHAGSSYSALPSWLSRLQVAVDVAKGLEYLHHLISPTLIHKSVGSRNILVGNDLRAKVAHVGVAVLTGEVGLFEEKFPGCDSGEIQPYSSGRRLTRSLSRSKKINGIQGYMPPEYLTSGQMSAKYDVFAFGVVLAEILSGKEAVYRRAAQKISLPELLHSIMAGDDSKIKLRRWMDPRLKDSYPLDDAHKVASIALKCVDPDPLKRPEMSDVGLRLQKLLSSAANWEATAGAHREMLSVSMQPR